MNKNKNIKTTEDNIIKNNNKIIDDNDNDNDFYYISIILKFLNAF